MMVEDLVGERPAASGPAGDRRQSARLPVRLLHARHRDEPVRGLSPPAGPPTQGEPSTTSSRAISAGAPVIAPLSPAGLADLRRRALGSICRLGRGRAPWTSRARGRQETSSSATKTSFFAAPVRLELLAALYARFPDATLVAGATDVACGSPSSCAIFPASSGSAGSRASTWSARRSMARCRSGAGVTLLDAAPHPRPAIHPDLGELLRPLRLRPGQDQRHGRRQHRQRLADRRPRAGLDRARRARGPAQGRDDAQASARGLLRRRPAGRTGRQRVRRRDRAPGSGRLSAFAPSSLEAVRRGHFRGMLGARSTSKAAGSRARDRLGGMAATPSGRRAPKRALIGAASTFGPGPRARRARLRLPAAHR